jgi:hypothetical protein
MKVDANEQRHQGTASCLIVNAWLPVSANVSVLALLMLSIALPSSHAGEESYRSEARFFRDSNLGQLAVILNSRRIARVPDGRPCDMPAISEMEFLVNNRRKEKRQDYPTGYLAVSALRIFDEEAPRNPCVELFRNDSWYRGTEGLNELPNLPVRPPDISHFVAVHQPKNGALDFASADAGLGGKWHAQILPNGYATTQDAWFWTRPFMDSDLQGLLRSFQPLKSDSEHIQLRALLIHFQEAPLGSRGPKLRFEIKSHNCSAMLVRTYSPLSEEYTNDALIRLKP